MSEKPSSNEKPPRKRLDVTGDFPSLGEVTKQMRKSKSQDSKTTADHPAITPDLADESTSPKDGEGASDK